MNLNKVALITGSTKGIGKDIAFFLANKGYDIVLNYAHDDHNAEKVFQELTNFSPSSICIKADISEPDEVKRLKNEVANKYGKLDVLINNAGVIKRPGGYDKVTDEDMLTTVKVNLLGPMYTIREFTELLKNSEEGNIINMSSTYSYNGSAAVLAYTASKAGINSITKAMALELSKFKIRVNGIAPSNFETDMTLSGGADLKDWIISTTPLGRLGQPSEISKCVDFLLDSPYITGHTIDIDGGQLLSI